MLLLLLLLLATAVLVLVQAFAASNGGCVVLNKASHLPMLYHTTPRDVVSYSTVCAP
jgi:hypothetical protein